MTRALVEDSIGRPFGGQSTSHYSSDRRENRNTCFLTVVSGRVVGQPECWPDNAIHARKDCATLGVHPICFSPTSVQFKGEINDALPRKRHQKRHLEFCNAYLLSRMPQVRVLPGAPSH